ncbi:MAG TPA: PIG-L family deacetylase, partial [Thermoanaerobaculia bacterium]
MTIEAQSIPYEPVRLRGERLLVLAPHPDDEVIGCGGLVAQHVRENRAVRVVIATDGAEADAAATDRNNYRRIREQESRHGLEKIGGVDDVHFLRFPDRGLGPDVAERIAEHLRDFRPDLILVPSPVEIHPDHVALSHALIELVQRDERLFGEHAVARVAFYEVSQPLRPNTIVDITDVADAKYEAIAAHQSQMQLRDYTAFARGLNAYRAMTMPPGVTAAEAYFVVELRALRTMAVSEIERLTGEGARRMVTNETLPISVIVRTKDRPELLREALDSIRAGGYPCEIVVVNDGGARPENVGDAKLIEHDRPRGRSEAANAGVRAATSQYVTFLDDDDLHYREHLPALANAARGSQHAGWYSDALSVFLRPGPSGAYEAHSRMRIYSHEFDRDLLLLDNYIPLPTLLVARDTFLDLGGFDSDFDLFEDWDFLIRLAQRGDLLHVPRVTCEVRHFEGGSSIVLAAGEGTERFRDAKLQVWSKHADKLDNHVIANAFERQKKRAGELYSSLIEAAGRADRTNADVARLEREKQELLASMSRLHETLNEANV